MPIGKVSARIVTPAGRLGCCKPVFFRMGTVPDPVPTACLRSLHRGATVSAMTCRNADADEPPSRTRVTAHLLLAVTCLPGSFACPPACWPACLLARLLAGPPACWPACLLARLPAGPLVAWYACSMARNRQTTERTSAAEARRALRVVFRTVLFPRFRKTSMV